MFFLPSPPIFLAFQLQHYQDRFAQAKSVQERSFIRAKLFHLKKQAACYLA